MFEGKLTIDVSDRLGALIAGLTDAVDGLKVHPAQGSSITPATVSPSATLAGAVPPAFTAAPTAPMTPTAAAQAVPTAAQAEPTAAPAAPTAAPAAPTAAPAAPTAAPTYTLAQISMAGAMLVQAQPAKRDELMALLQRYGTNAVANLKPEQLGAFATDLRGMGAKI